VSRILEDILVRSHLASITFPLRFYQYEFSATELTKLVQLAIAKLGEPASRCFGDEHAAMEAEEQERSNLKILLKPGLTSQFSHNYLGNYEFSVKMPDFWHI